jgi:hypothetical protein
VQLERVVSRLNPFHVPTPHLFKLHLNIILRSEC